MALPKPLPQSGIHGFHDIALIGPYYRWISWFDVDELRGKHGIKNLALFVARLKVDPDELSQFIKEQLSKLTLQALGAYDGLGSEPGSLQSLLIDDLKRIVETQTLR